MPTSHVIINSIKFLIKYDYLFMRNDYCKSFVVLKDPTGRVHMSKGPIHDVMDVGKWNKKCEWMLFVRGVGQLHGN